MENVTVQIEEVTEDYIITLNATMLGNHIMASATGKVVIKTHDIGMFTELLFEHHHDVIGTAKFSVNGNNYTISDPLWREFLTVFTPYEMALYRMETASK